jgi:hypothetical protein
VVAKRDPGKEIRALEEKREALEKAVKIAVNIERLHDSLEASLLLGQPSSDIPKEVVLTYTRLQDSTKSQPSATLMQSLATLERVVRTNLGRILKISELDDEVLVGPEAGKIEALLKDYQKQSQTAIALRVLLHSRGEATEPSELYIPAEQIRARLSTVKQKERAYRKVIRTEIVTMMTETERMLAKPELSHAMQQFLTASHQDLQDNLNHLDSGNSISAMPVAMEMVEMSEHEISTFDTHPAAEQADPHAEELPEIQKQTLFSSSFEAPPPPAAELPTRKKGLFRRVWEWATTPDSETWKKLKQKNGNPRR